MTQINKYERFGRYGVAAIAIAGLVIVLAGVVAAWPNPVTNPENITLALQPGYMKPNSALQLECSSTVAQSIEIYGQGYRSDGQHISFDYVGSLQALTMNDQQFPLAQGTQPGPAPFNSADGGQYSGAITTVQVIGPIPTVKNSIHCIVSSNVAAFNLVSGYMNGAPGLCWPGYCAQTNGTTKGF